MNCQQTGHSSNDCPLHSRNAQNRGTGMSQQSGKISVVF